jgi:phage/plasmid-associated DNA primase
MEWLRVLYCEPKHLHSTCPVFYSLEGAGKGALQTGLLKLFGKYSFLTASLGDVVGNDNHQIAGMKLIMPNEIADSSKDVQLSEDGIKPIIDPILNVRGKWVRPYTIKNYAGAIFATNHKQSLPVSANQRRFAFIECNNEYCAIKKNPNTRTYFDALFAEIEDARFGNALHTYLTNMKPTGADVRRLPDTALLLALRKASASVIELFVADFARELRIGMSDAHASYRQWCNENGYKPLCTKNWSLQMNDYCELRKTRARNLWRLRTEHYERFPVEEGEDDAAELLNDDCGI